MEVRLGKPGDERTLWLREGKGGRMLLSTDGRTFDTLGRDMIGRPRLLRRVALRSAKVS